MKSMQRRIQATRIFNVYILATISILFLVTIISLILLIFPGNVLAFNNDDEASTPVCAEITVHPENWRYLYYRDHTLCLTTTGSVCSNFLLLLGDLDPSTVDCSLDEMARCQVNHFLLIMDMRKGQPDAAILEPLDYNLDITWNEQFFRLLRKTVDYAYGLDIIVDVVFTSECMLEPFAGRWEEHLWNQANGGPVPSWGFNFFELERPTGKPNTWSWKMWNSYYQRSYFEKVLAAVGDYPNVICNPCWEIDDMGMKGYNWFITASAWIREIEESPHLIALTPCRPGEFCMLECVDCLLIENRGSGRDFLVYGKPVINAGPEAEQIWDEPEFMFECAARGIHPATNLLSECPAASSGYLYAKSLHSLYESVETWEDEPGDEITEDSLPPCN